MTPGYFAMRVVVDYNVRDRLVSPLTTTWKGVATKRPYFWPLQLAEFGLFAGVAAALIAFAAWWIHQRAA